MRMRNVWFPIPVTLFVRRVVNVLSSLSITHHYLLPLRSTDKNGLELPSQWATRVQRSNGRHEAERRVSWSTIVEKSLDDLLQASRNISIPWFYCARFSLQYGEQADDPTRTENYRSSHRQEPPDPTNGGKKDSDDLDEIHRLIQNPVLYDPLRSPRYPIVLCHGLYGFDVRGPSSFPSLRMHYWSSVLNILRKTAGAEVIVTAVPATGSIASRAEQLDRFLQVKALGRGINFMAHSMGGLDCRHLITHLKPVDYTPLSLMTIATPHRGSPFMDWCKDYLGLGRRRSRTIVTAGSEPMTSMGVGATSEAPPRYSSSTSSAGLSFSSLPSSFTTFLLGMFDPPAYANLTTTYLTETFNPRTPNDPRVRYFSVAGRTGGLNIWHPLWLPKLVLDGTDGGEGNDGLVSVHSARWGEFLGTVEGADHWTLRGASGIELGVDLPSVVGDAWGFADWGRFVRAFGRVEGRTAEIKNEGGEERAQKGSGWREEVKTAEERRALSEDGLKTSTDRLSAVLDWLVEQVPVATRNGISFAGEDGNSGAGGGAGGKRLGDATGWNDAARVAPQKRRGDLESKGDLERLYVALARKLYDEGL